jgi:hypothetical protein
MGMAVPDPIELLRAGQARRARQAAAVAQVLWRTGEDLTGAAYAGKAWEDLPDLYRQGITVSAAGLIDAWAMTKGLDRVEVGARYLWNLSTDRPWNSGTAFERADARQIVRDCLVAIAVVEDVEALRGNTDE